MISELEHLRNLKAHAGCQHGCEPDHNTFALFDVSRVHLSVQVRRQNNLVAYRYSALQMIFS